MVLFLSCMLKFVFLYSHYIKAYINIFQCFKVLLLLNEYIETESVLLALFASIHVLASCGIQILVNLYNLGDCKQKDFSLL